MKIHYRPGGYRDWRGLARLIREGFPDLSEGMVSAYCREHRGGIELAFGNGALVGATIGSPRPAIDAWWLELIAVAERARGRGVARALLERFEMRAAREGYGRVALVTRPWNAAARRLYEKGGYRSVVTGSREVEFEKELADVVREPRSSKEPSRLRSIFDRVAYRGLVTLPDNGTPFFPTRGTVQTMRVPGASLVSPAGVAELPAEPMRVRHGLPNHPLFGDRRIKETIRRMAVEDIEIRAIPTVDERRYSRSERIEGLDGERAFELCAERPLWINLHHVERYDEAYRDLMALYLRGLDIDELKPEVYEAGCFLLLSSGRASVHFHADPDQSFLNQIRGSKRAFVYPSAILAEPTLETLAHTGDHDVATWHPEYEARAYPPVHLAPGDGVLLPLYAPHRVENDDAVSVSLSIGFHTRRSHRRSRVHLVNRELRALGLPVTPWGQSPLRDGVKERLHPGLRIKNKMRHGPLRSHPPR